MKAAKETSEKSGTDSSVIADSEDSSLLSILGDN